MVVAPQPPNSHYLYSCAPNDLALPEEARVQPILSTIYACELDSLQCDCLERNCTIKRNSCYRGSMTY